MKFSWMSVCLVFSLLVIPAFIFAIDIPTLPSLPSSPGLGTERNFGGKIGGTDRCFCPTQEPLKMGIVKLDYDIFWKGATKTKMSLFYDPVFSHLYKHGKTDKGVWHLGKYKEESASCKYITKADYAAAAAQFLLGGSPMPRCSGTLNADGTIIYAGTSKGSGLSLPGVPSLPSLPL